MGSHRGLQSLIFRIFFGKLCAISEKCRTFAVMKPSKKYNYYIWIINTLKTYRKQTLEELNQKWQDDKVADGNPLARSTFNRYRDAIQDIFGIVIDCTEKTYKYYISNPGVLSDDSLEGWLFSTLTVHGVLADSASVRDRILLESVPEGEKFLEPIIRAIKTGHRLRLGYQKFGFDGYEKTICPYAVKMFHQRWYVLALNDEGKLRIYALDDRMTMINQSDDTFKMPKNFSAEAYFADYYGVLTIDEPMAHVVVRAYNRTPNYLRTLPMHHSQREISTNDEYTDFSFDIRPTPDFLKQLKSHEPDIEVLEPLEVRQKMKKLIEESLNRYK